MNKAGGFVYFLAILTAQVLTEPSSREKDEFKSYHSSNNEVDDPYLSTPMKTAFQSDCTESLAKDSAEDNPTARIFPVTQTAFTKSNPTLCNTEDLSISPDPTENKKPNDDFSKQASEHKRSVSTSPPSPCDNKDTGSNCFVESTVFYVTLGIMFFVMIISMLNACT